MTIAAVDDKTGADRLALLSLAGVYALDDNRVATLADVPGAQIQAPPAIVTTPRGELVRFADRQTGLSPYGAYLNEPAATNLCSANNTAPTDTTASGRWIHGAGNPNPVKFARVTPQNVGATALRDVTHHETGAYVFRALVDNGTISGDVIEVYNTSTTDQLTARPAATIDTLNQNVFSTYAMIVQPSASGNPTIGFTDSGGYNSFSNTYWDRVYRISTTAASVGGGFCAFQIPPQCRVWFILWQVEGGSQPTNPIACPDTVTPAAVRPVRSFSVGGLARQLTLPFAAYAEVWLSNVDNVTRDLFSLTASGSANRLLVTREWSNDNSLKLSVSNGAYTPVFRKFSGAGSIRTAVLVDDEVSRFSFAGLTKIDPFTDMPADLDTINIGSAGIWLREFRILEKVRGDTLEAMTAPGADAVVSDTARYVSADGDDTADGKTPATAWRTTNQVKAQFTNKVIGAGMHILFRRGDRGFAGFQVPPDDVNGNPVIELTDKCVYGAYGEGARPRFDAGGDYGFFAHGVDYAQWDGLDISQFMMRPIDLFGASGPMITDCILGPTSALATSASRTGLSIRGGNNAEVVSGKLNVYLAGNTVQGITAPSSHGGAGDDVYIENMGGKIIYRGGHLGTAVGAGADGLQVSSSPTASVELRYVYIDAPVSGKGGLAIEAGSFTLRDFDINGTNFCVTSSSSNTVIQRGVVRGARLNSYSSGIGLDNGQGVSGHDYHISDVDIYNCNRGVSISTAGGTAGSNFIGSISGTTLTVTAVSGGIVALGGVLFAGGIADGTTVVKQLTPTNPTGGVGTYQVSIAQTAAATAIFQAGPNRVNVFAERVRVFGCDEGLHVDLPTSGDLTGLRYFGCNRDINVRATVIPPGGVGYFKY